MTRRTPERRAASRKRPRVPLDGKLSLDLTTDVQAVASGGACVRLPFAPAVGTRHAFTFSLGDEPLRVDGVVRHSRQIATGDFEVGIEFEGLGEAEQARLEAFIQSKRSP